MARRSIGIIIIDQYLASKNSDFRMPVLAVAVGLYLPLDLDTSIFVGGIIAWLADRYFKRKSGGHDATKHAEAKELGSRYGLLLASGLITGEAIMGILIAIAIVAAGSAENIPSLEAVPGGSLPSLLILAGACYLLYRVIVKTYDEHVS